MNTKQITQFILKELEELNHNEDWLITQTRTRQNGVVTKMGFEIRIKEEREE